MSVDSRAREAVKRADLELATIDIPDPASVISSARRRRATRTAVACVAVGLGIAALAVPAVTWISEDDGTPSVVGAPASTPPPREGKQYIVDIESEAVAAADDVGVNLTRLTRKSLARIGQRLPDLGRVVRIEVDPTMVLAELGLGVRTDRTSGDVFVYVDPERMDAELLRTWLPAVLARESLISVRVSEGPGRGSTLGDRIVTAGLGDAFAREVFPETPRPLWTDAIGQEAQQLAWAQAQPILDEMPPDSDAEDALSREWFNGRGSFPRWTGTTLGFEIVTAYLDGHPQEIAARLVGEPAQRIIADSGYDPTAPDPNRPRCYRDLAQTREVPCSDWEATFDAAGVLAEPGRCYIVGALSAPERPCRQEVDEGAE